MAYAAVKGGREAIENSIRFLDVLRGDGSTSPLDIEQIKKELHFLVDRVMGEGSLYAPDLAAMAIKQSAGDTLEAAFMVRAYRTTLPRFGESIPVSTRKMRIVRRISSAFKDIPGGQILGPSQDYSLRLLDFSLIHQDQESLKDKYRDFLHQAGLKQDIPDSFPKLMEILRQENLLVSKSVVHQENNTADITRESLRIPASRSAALQTMARGETGGMLALAYSNMRGYGAAHPTIGELRVGFIPVKIKHPLDKRELMAGWIPVTEAEIISSLCQEGDQPKFQAGYGICFGHNETKAISMATLDVSMRAEHPSYPSEDQEFVLMHIDGIESMGFANHFKLPHYVTFQSELDQLRSSREKMSREE
ncbi:MAG: carbon-phosphorus lyase complex subunit PhnI [Desulfonatronovibrio sp.]